MLLLILIDSFGLILEDRQNSGIDALIQLWTNQETILPNQSN